MSDIDYSKLRSLTAGKLARALVHDGFELRRQTGSHQRYVHADGRRVTVALTRKGKTFAIGTLKSMIERQAKWNEEDLRRLKLLK